MSNSRYPDFKAASTETSRASWVGILEIPSPTFGISWPSENLKTPPTTLVKWLMTGEGNFLNDRMIGESTDGAGINMTVAMTNITIEQFLVLE